MFHIFYGYSEVPVADLGGGVQGFHGTLLLALVVMENYAGSLAFNITQLFTLTTTKTILIKYDIANCVNCSLILSLNNSTLEQSIGCCGNEFHILIASGIKELL